MPLSPASKKKVEGLRIPQARVLKALMPKDPSDDPQEWPFVTRAQLGVRAGYTAISGTITRALNGIREGSSSGDAHPGLLARELVQEQEVDIDGLTEINYRITVEGIRQFTDYVRINGDNLPAVKEAFLCTNERYAKEQPQGA